MGSNRPSSHVDPGQRHLPPPTFAWPRSDRPRVQNGDIAIIGNIDPVADNQGEDYGVSRHTSIDLAGFGIDAMDQSAGSPTNTLF
jgi:hypothetical protein